MMPRVILHIATSLDGRITNFPADLDLYYSLAATWNIGENPPNLLAERFRPLPGQLLLLIPQKLRRIYGS